MREMWSFALADGALIEKDRVADAAHVLQQAYADLAPAEALTRALVHARIEGRDEAKFWAQVFLEIVVADPARSTQNRDR